MSRPEAVSSEEGTGTARARGIMSVAAPDGFHTVGPVPGPWSWWPAACDRNFHKGRQQVTLQAPAPAPRSHCRRLDSPALPCAWRHPSRPQQRAPGLCFCAHAPSCLQALEPLRASWLLFAGQGPKASVSPQGVNQAALSPPGLPSPRHCPWEASPSGQQPPADGTAYFHLQERGSRTCVFKDAGRTSAHSPPHLSLQSRGQRGRWRLRTWEQCRSASSFPGPRFLTASGRRPVGAAWAGLLRWPACHWGASRHRSRDRAKQAAVRPSRDSRWQAACT